MLHRSLVNANATYQLGVWLGQHLQPGAVLLLQGDLGAGKTTLVQGIGWGLGVTDAIDSPTFTLMNEYYTGRCPLYHADLYRLEIEAVADLHLELYWQGVEWPIGILAIEWSERLPYLPDSYLAIALFLEPQTDAPEHRIAQLSATANFAQSNLLRELQLME